MKRGLLVTTLCLIMVLCTFSCAFASEEPTVTFDKETQEFVFSNGTIDDFGNNFKNMIPGDKKTQKFILHNTDDRELKFYFNIDVLKDVDNSCEGAVYNVELACDGEVFYQGLLGGDDGRLVDLTTGALSDDILLAELEKNEKANLSMKIAFDGDTMGNEYQNQEAVIQIKFSASYDGETIIDEDVPLAKPKEPITVIDKVTEVITTIAPKTGDSVQLVFFTNILVMAFSGLLLSLLLKKANQDQGGDSNEIYK